MFLAFLFLLQLFLSVHGFTAVQQNLGGRRQTSTPRSLRTQHQQSDFPATSTDAYYNHVTLFLSDIPNSGTAASCNYNTAFSQRRRWEDQLGTFGNSLSSSYNKFRQDIYSTIMQTERANIPIFEQDAPVDASPSVQETTSSVSTTQETAAATPQSPAVLAKLRQIVAQTWWTFPLTLCLVPPFCAAVLSRPALTPHFWKMITMDHLAATSQGMAVISVFLVSNIFYFAAGAYLLQQFPMFGGRNNHPNSQEKQAKATQQYHETVSKPNRFSMVPSSLPVLKAGISLPMSLPMSLPTRRLKQLAASWCPYSGMGLWMLTAAVVSTIFHSVQALGNSAVAEALCYLDHGVAGACTFYFWHMCGRPQKKTASLGIVSLLLLSTNAGYEWLHSAWHAVSAATACVWAQQAAPIASS